jgi:hypothetical protein
MGGDCGLLGTALGPCVAAPGGVGTAEVGLTLEDNVVPAAVSFITAVEEGPGSPCPDGTTFDGVLLPEVLRCNFRFEFDASIGFLPGGRVDTSFCFPARFDCAGAFRAGAEVEVGTCCSLLWNFLLLRPDSTSAPRQQSDQGRFTALRELHTRNPSRVLRLVE